MKTAGLPDDPVLFGRDATPGIVAVEHVENRRGPDEMEIFTRHGGETRRTRERFEPFVVATADAAQECPAGADRATLTGDGPLNTLLTFATWRDCQKAKAWLARETGRAPGAPDAPYLYLSDPVQQHLTRTGKTLFRGMAFDDLRRLQVDIECETAEGYEFCNAERESDRIMAIGLRDSTGWSATLSVRGSDEKHLLEAFVKAVVERDPDVIEGHNLFNFDLPYLEARAKRHGVKLALGRDGAPPSVRPSRLAIGERTISYSRYEFWGRHVVDTLFLVHAYDIAHRSLDGFGLKDVAIHFGLAAPDRTYITGSDISRAFREEPDRLLAYVGDDVREAGDLSQLLSPSNFVQAQMLPYAYQTVCVRGNATKIDALMIREYLAQRRALPMPDAARPFAGGYTDLFVRGVVRDVHHCDVRSLYPSLMLVRRLAPRSDGAGVFLHMLERLRAYRLQAKERMRAGASSGERLHFDALQGAFKVLINSFYGYLGFSQGRFSDFAMAEEVTRAGRDVLRGMIEWLRAHGATPVEIDTDGIYFVPPAFPLKPGASAAVGGKRAAALADLAAFRAALAASLPEGIEIEFDGEYRSMFSYKMKNYALLDERGEVTIRGAALKSRGLEPFQREFLRDMVRLELEDRAGEIPALKETYARAIRERTKPIEWLGKSEMLQDSPAAYAAKRARGDRSRGAAYELALRSDREFRAGDMITYYVAGTAKSVPVHEYARRTRDWNPAKRDENVAYYLAKLDALYDKFQSESQEENELALGDGGGGEDKE
jgi:DNA polymerase elongation subunit (family B)